MNKKILQLISGGLIFDYNLRMVNQITNKILAWSFLGCFLVCCTFISLTSWNELRLVGYQHVSKLLVTLDYPNQVIWNQSNKTQLTALHYQRSAVIQNAVNHAQQTLMSRLKQVAMIGLVMFFACFMGVTRFFTNKGKAHREDQFISGTYLAQDIKETLHSLKQSQRGLSDIKLASVLPMPRGSEKQGLFFHGTTGSGKTQALMVLLDQIRRSGDAAIIYDKECTIKPYFFREGFDAELNPISSHCANWDLWEECENPLELGNFSTYQIPKSVQGSDPFWVDAARTILTSTAWKMKDCPDKEIIKLLQYLLTTTLDEMRHFLKGTEAENLVSKEIEKTAISIKSVLATYTKALRYLEGLNKSDKPKFSIKKWVNEAATSEKSQKSWLFITSRSQYHHEIKPLISMWLGLAMKSIQSLNPDPNRRIWIIMDELASLHRLEMLSDTLADIRKFGGCVAIGIQSIYQLKFLYGDNEARAIVDLLNTSLYFRSPRTEVAEWVSNELSEQTINEMKESQSFGPDSVRDGNTLGSQKTKRKTVEVSAIKTLEDLMCYVSLLGKHPLTLIKTKVKKRNTLCASLVVRPINFDALETINSSALTLQQAPEVNKEVRSMAQFEEEALLVAEHDAVPSKKGVKKRQGDFSTDESTEGTHDIELREAPLVVRDMY
jgi:type IV conjugative transfer system coupling protein TraD